MYFTDLWSLVLVNTMCSLLLYPNTGDKISMTDCEHACPAGLTNKQATKGYTWVWHTCNYDNSNIWAHYNDNSSSRSTQRRLLCTLCKALYRDSIGQYLCGAAREGVSEWLWWWVQSVSELLRPADICTSNGAVRILDKFQVFDHIYHHSYDL